MIASGSPWRTSSLNAEILRRQPSAFVALSHSSFAPAITSPVFTSSFNAEFLRRLYFLIHTLRRGRACLCGGGGFFLPSLRCWISSLRFMRLTRISGSSYISCQSIALAPNSLAVGVICLSRYSGCGKYIEAHPFDVSRSYDNPVKPDTVLSFVTIPPYTWYITLLKVWASRSNARYVKRDAALYLVNVPPYNQNIALSIS